MADFVLVAHFALVAFITAGYFVIPLGAALRWSFVRRRGWRLAHLGAIAFVAAEALLGIACPLTVMESRLRGAGDGGEGFVEYWLGRLLYWDWPGWVFTALYVAAAVLAGLLWRWVAPARRAP
ncbi:MAG: DUF2784 domain-containing protein [Rhodocyclaceae bacterium]